MSHNEFGTNGVEDSPIRVNANHKKKWSDRMDERQDQKNTWIEVGVKLALSLAILFPVYVILYATFPASVLAIYLISAVVFALFAPWDDLKKKFLS